MKKSLIAVAVAATLPAFAQAQTNVTMYGIADVSIGSADNGGATKNAVTVFSGGMSTSRFGVRGTEELGGGLKATFNIESGVEWDTGDASNGTQFWARRAVAGLAGGFGEVRLGRDYTPGFSSAGATDVMGYGLLGNWLTFTAQANNRGITTRASNGIHYTSPNMGGLLIRAMYAVGERNTDPTTGGNMFGLSGVYAQGPLTAQGYYMVTKRVAGTDAVSDKQYGLGAGYNFGMFRVAANYGVADRNGPDDKHTGWGLGAGVKLGTGELLVNFISQKIDLAAGTDPKANSWGVAYVHPMSRRTNLYASVGALRNNSAGNFALRYSGSSIGAAGADADPRGLMLGMRHTF